MSYMNKGISHLAFGVGPFPLDEVRDLNHRRRLGIIRAMVREAAYLILGCQLPRAPIEARLRPLQQLAGETSLRHLLRDTVRVTDVSPPPPRPRSRARRVLWAQRRTLHRQGQANIAAALERLHRMFPGGIPPPQDELPPSALSPLEIPLSPVSDASTWDEPNITPSEDDHWPSEELPSGAPRVNGEEDPPSGASRQSGTEELPRGAPGPSARSRRMATLGAEANAQLSPLRIEIPAPIPAVRAYTWLQDDNATSPIRRAPPMGFRGEVVGPVPVPPASKLLRPSRIRGRVYDALGDLHTAATRPEWSEARENEVTQHARLLGCVTFFDNPARHGLVGGQEMTLPVPIWHAYGWAPRWAGLWTHNSACEFHERLQADPRTVAVGPIGLDRTLRRSTEAAQITVVENLLRVAMWNRLPVLAFNREEESDFEGGQSLVDLFRKIASPVPVCVQADGISMTVTHALMELGTHFHFGVTYGLTERAMRRPWGAESRLLRLIPLERILIFSMAPYETTAPWSAAIVVEHLAHIRGVELVVLEIILASNFRRFYAKQTDPRPFL